MTDTQVTQVALEQWNVPVPDSRATQVALEMWAMTATVTGQALVTQVALEMWAPAGLPSTGKVKVWNGSAWVEKPVKVWTLAGTWDVAAWDISDWAPDSWLVKPVKVWNGSSWMLA